MQVADCDVFRLEDPEEPGGFRYLLVEPFLDGKYLKVRRIDTHTARPNYIICVSPRTKIVMFAYYCSRCEIVTFVPVLYPEFG